MSYYSAKRFKTSMIPDHQDWNLGTARERFIVVTCIGATLSEVSEGDFEDLDTSVSSELDQSDDISLSSLEMLPSSLPSYPEIDWSSTSGCDCAR